MTAHNIQERSNLATNPDMGFDEMVAKPMKAAAAKHPGRYDSVPFDERCADIPAMAPISPCYSDASTAASSAAHSITGMLANIEHKYDVDPHILGSGHHGSVRACVDRATGERFAVKSVRKNNPAVKPGGLAREIQLLREMRHESIVRLVDVYEDMECVHLVTNVYDGGELFDRIVEKSAEDNGAACFAEREAAKIIEQVLSATRYMHEKDLAHRDLKPENILFETADADSPIRIIDFGLARKHFADVEPPISTIVGTPYYIAPEVLKKRYDKSCDCWSIGIIAYILIAGYPPFNGANNAEVYDAIRRGRYRFHSHDWVGTSRESRDFIRRLLQRDPRKRMTVEQALDHPWILRHTNDATMVDEDRQDLDSSVEIVYHELSRRDSIICGSGCERRDIRVPLLLEI